MTQDEIIEMAQECRLIGMRPHLDGIYSEALVAFAKLVAEKALAEHAMQEVQKLGQEIEQKIGCVNHECDQCKAQPEQEPVAWIDADGNVSDNNDHKCFPIPLYTSPPQRTWVNPQDEEIKILWIQYRAALPRYLCFAKALLARAMEKNT